MAHRKKTKKQKPKSEPTQPRLNEQSETDFNKSFPSLTPIEIINHKPNPENFITEKGWLKKASSTTTIGSTGIGKSVLLEQAAVDLALGRPLWGIIPVRRAVRTLLIEAENDRDVLQIDFKSILKHTNADVKEVNEMLTVKHVRGLPNANFGACLEDFIRECDPEVVILDPYQAFVSHSMSDEASFFSWRDQVDPLMEHYNFALWLAAHTGKPRDTSDWTDEEWIYKMLGTSTMANWVRTDCVLVKEGQHGTKYKMHFSKSPARLGVGSKDGKLVRDIYIEHSGLMEEPYWKLSDIQQGMAKATLRDKVRLYHYANPDRGSKWLAKNCLDMGDKYRQVEKYLKEVKSEEMKKTKRGTGRKKKSAVQTPKPQG